MRICQLEKLLGSIIILSLFSSCAYIKTEWNNFVAPKNEKGDKAIERKYSVRSDRIILPSWFKIPKAYVQYDNDKVIPTHPFFDNAANWRKAEQLINYVEISPAESEYQYDLDLPSGKLYKVRNNCANKDIWGAYIGKIARPEFSMGIVPQMYNQEKKPQKIIIFKTHFDDEPFQYIPDEIRDARVIGSVILEYCDAYPCDARNRWTATQMLVGVDLLDSNFKEIKTFAELKDKINWPYTKAYLENQFGVHNLANKTFPAYRVTAELEIENTEKYFKEKSQLVDMEKLSNWRKNCLSLYDLIWEKVVEIRSSKNSQREKFFDYFKSFYIYDADKYYSCQKIVKPGSINENPERNWFFNFISAYMHLEQNGYYYNCAQAAWLQNSKIDAHHTSTNQLNELRLCKATEFEKMFDHAMNGLVMLKNQRNKSFRFIEYDSEHGGSHQKIYSWITYSSKKLACEDGNIHPEIFPSDVFWPAFKIDEPKE